MPGDFNAIGYRFGNALPQFTNDGRTHYYMDYVRAGVYYRGVREAVTADTTRAFELHYAYNAGAWCQGTHICWEFLFANGRVDRIDTTFHYGRPVIGAEPKNSTNSGRGHYMAIQAALWQAGYATPASLTEACADSPYFTRVLATNDMYTCGNTAIPACT